MKHVPEKTLAAQRDSLFKVEIFWVSSTTETLYISYEFRSESLKFSKLNQTTVPENRRFKI
ncbi:hypothetical protein IC582_007129 [Cucumis melo]